MELKFSSKARKLKAAYEKGDIKILVREYDRDSADAIAEAINILVAADSLHDVMQFQSLRPHEIDNGTVFSLSLIGRKRLTLKTLDKAGNPTKKIDYSTPYGIVIEVSEHYGD